MRIRKIIKKPMTLDRDGIHLVGGVDAVINVNINHGEGQSTTGSRQVTRIVQQGGGSRKYTGEEASKEVEHD